MYKWEWKLWEVRREEHPDRTILTLYRGEEPVDSVTTYARYTTMCEPMRTARLIEPDVAARLVEKHLGEGYNVVWKGRSWEVVP